MTNPTTANFLRVSPGGSIGPIVGSHLSQVSGQTIPNIVIAGSGAAEARASVAGSGDRGVDALE